VEIRFGVASRLADACLLRIRPDFQLGFQAETLTSQWLHSPPFLAASLATPFKHGPEAVEYVAIPKAFQGQLLTPTRGVCDCYDMDDFTRAQNEPGSTLITQVIVPERRWLPHLPSMLSL